MAANAPFGSSPDSPRELARAVEMETARDDAEDDVEVDEAPGKGASVADGRDGERGDADGSGEPDGGEGPEPPPPVAEAEAEGARAAATQEPGVGAGAGAAKPDLAADVPRIRTRAA